MNKKYVLKVNGNVPDATGNVVATASLPPLTSGSVLFSDGTTLSQDNLNLFWNNTTKRLGLGINTPASLLDVNGTSYFGLHRGAGDALLSIGNNIVNIASPTKMTGTAIAVPETALRIFRVGTASNKWNASVDFQIGTFAAASTAATKFIIKLANNNVNIPNLDVLTLQSDSRVGINNTNPAQALDVVGSIKLTGDIIPNNANATAGKALVSAGQNVAAVWTTLSTVATSGNYNDLTNKPTQFDAQAYFEAVAGYDAGETQILKHVNGVLTWVTE